MLLVISPSQDLFSQPLLIVVLFRFNCAFVFLYFGFHNVLVFSVRITCGEGLDIIFSCVFYNMLQNMGISFLADFYSPSRPFHPPRGVSSVAVSEAYTT